MLFPPSRKKWSNYIHTVWYKVTWRGGILIPKFLNATRVEGFKWEKQIHGRKLAAPKTTKRRTKHVKKTQKVKCLYFIGRYLARQRLGPIQGVQPQTLWFIVRHYAISFRGPNYSFSEYHVGISFRTESQCDYRCRLSLKKLKVFIIREQKRRRKKDKAIFEDSILLFNFL